MRLSSSIALCTYNGEQYIQEQLESLVAQTRLPDELVVCDDCSTDNTVQIVADFAKTAPFPVRIIQNHANLKPDKNFVQAALSCSGDIIFFCDQDDIWDNNKIIEFMNVFEKRQEIGVIVSDSKFQNTTFTNSLVACRLLNSRFRELIKKDNVLPMVNRFEAWFGHGMAFRSRFNRIIFPIPDDTNYDRWVFLVLNAITKSVFLDSCLTNHRTHSQSVTSQYCSYSKTTEYKKQQHDNNTLLYIYQTMGQHALNMSQFLLNIDEKESDNIQKTRLYARFLAGRYRHYYRRAEIRKGGIKAYYFIFAEMLNGGYFYYSSGLLSFGKDLLGR